MAEPLGNVLVLNSLFQAVQVTGIRRAFRLFYAGRARAIDPSEFLSYDFENWCDLPPRAGDVVIHTPTRAIRIPSVIQLVHYDRLPSREVRFTRRNIFYRDRNRCQYCGHYFPTSELSIDHVIPRKQNGDDSWTNLVCACVRCNARKGGRTPDQAHMKLIRPPVMPRRNPMITLRMGNQKYESWKTFLDNAYWSVELR